MERPWPHVKTQQEYEVEEAARILRLADAIRQDKATMAAVRQLERATPPKPRRRRPSR